jgi:hypothetical protein
MNRSAIPVLMLLLALLATANSALAVERLDLEDPASYRPVTAVDVARSEIRIADERYRLSPNVVIHRPDGRRGPLQVGEQVAILSMTRDGEEDLPVIHELRVLAAP